MDLVSGEDDVLLVLAAGHIGLLTGCSTKKNLWLNVKERLSKRSSA
jgi:hypothetical protein